MALITPVVEPAINSSGNSLTVNPKIVFDKAIDIGSISESNFFIVAVNREGDIDSQSFVTTSNFISDIVPATFKYRRVSLNSDQDFTGHDYGDTLNAGNMYRSEVILVPRQLLNANTNYAVIISKNISLLSVFDSYVIQQTGSGKIKTAGVFSGLTNDTYLISVVSSGDQSTAEYTWTRVSDSFTSTVIRAKNKYTEIDKGVKIRFDTGSYQSGDMFRVKAIPADNLIELFSWNFSTGVGQFSQPQDEMSDRIVNLPVLNPNSTQPQNVDPNAFKVVSVHPETGASLVRLANKAIARIDSVFVQTLINTDEFNGFRFEITSGGTLGAEEVIYSAGNITVKAEIGQSTSHGIVDALMASPDFIINFEAFALPKVEKVKLGKTRVARGARDNQITITFNKDIDPASVAGKTKITRSGVYPFTLEEDLYYSTEVQANKLILTIED
jgi:hypothetical protein